MILSVLTDVVECLHVLSWLLGVHTSFFQIQNGSPSPPPPTPPYGQIQPQSPHAPTLCNVWGPLPNGDHSNMDTHSGLEYTVELNGYAEFGSFPPSCTSRGTSTANDTAGQESGSGEFTSFQQMLKIYIYILFLCFKYITLLLFLFFLGILSHSHPSPEVDATEDADFFPPPPPPVFIGPDDLPILTPSDEPHPSPPPAQFGRSSTARVSFREPISSSYSVEEDDEVEEDDAVEIGRKDKDEVEQEDEEDEADGSFRHKLHHRGGMPPRMDLLGNRNG